jgi:hypothetical protein
MMPNPLPRLLAIIAFILFVLPMPVYAAFPVQPNGTTIVVDNNAYKEKINQAIAKYTSPQEGHTAKSSNGGLGLAALVLGVAGVFLFGAAFLAPTLGFLGTFGFLSSLLAIIFGAIGLRGENASYARAGMILGIVTLGLLLLLAIAAIIALILFW